MRQLFSAGRPLVLKQFNLDPQSGHVSIVGRKPGIVAFLFTLMGLDATTTFRATPHEIQVHKASLFGQTRLVFPIPNVASAMCGYLKPIQFLFIAGFLVLSGLYSSISTDSGAIMGISLFLAAVFVLAYFLSKKLFVAVESSGGSGEVIVFKPSVIEGVSVDINTARDVIAMISQSIVRTQTHGKPDTLAPSKPAQLGQLGVGQSAQSQRQNVSPACPQCGGPTRWYADHNTHWCDRCGRAPT